MLNGSPIVWGSKKRIIVALSSSEAEYIAISDVCKDVIFVVIILEFFGFKIIFPTKIMVDNKGAIFMTNNSLIKKTKNIHTRYLFVKEYIESGIIEVEHVKSDENLADPFTKNLSKEKFEYHMKKIISEIELS